MTPAISALVSPAKNLSAISSRSRGASSASAAESAQPPIARSRRPRAPGRTQVAGLAPQPAWRRGGAARRGRRCGRSRTARRAAPAARLERGACGRRARRRSRSRPRRRRGRAEVPRHRRRRRRGSTGRAPRSRASASLRCLRRRCAVKPRSRPYYAGRGSITAEYRCGWSVRCPAGERLDRGHSPARREAQAAAIDSVTIVDQPAQVRLGDRQRRHQHDHVAERAHDRAALAGLETSPGGRAAATDGARRGRCRP